MTRSIVLDTNLLLLFVVGAVDRTLISKHKRTKSYTKEDFELLLRVLSPFDEIVVTSGILVECSNLLRQIEDPICSELTERLKLFIETATEHRHESRLITKAQVYPRLGLSDAGILESVLKGIPLITADFDLYLAALKINHQTVNFNHLRQESLSKA